MLLLIVGIIAVSSFAYYLAATQKQAQDLNSFRQNVANDRLRIDHTQFFPDNPLTQFQFNTSSPLSSFGVSVPYNTTSVSDNSTTDNYTAGAYAGWIISFSANSTFKGTVTNNTASILRGGTGVFTFSPALSTTITDGTFNVTQPSILFYITENPANVSEVTVQNGTDRLTTFPWPMRYSFNVILWNSTPSNLGHPDGKYSELNTGSYAPYIPCFESPTANTGYHYWSIVFNATSCAGPGNYTIISGCTSCNSSFATAAIDYFTLKVMNFNIQQSGLVDIEVNDSWVSNFFANGQSWGGGSLPLPLAPEGTQTVQVFVNSLKIFADEPMKITLQSTAGNFFSANYEPPSALITQSDFQQESVQGGNSTIYDVQVFSGLSSLEPDPNASIAFYMWTVNQTGVHTLCPTSTCTSPPVTGSGFELQWNENGTYRCIDPQKSYTVTLTVQDSNGLTSTGSLFFQGDSQAYYNSTSTCRP